MFVLDYCCGVEHEVGGEGEDDGEDHARCSQAEARVMPQMKKRIHHRHEPFHGQGDGQVYGHHQGGLKHNTFLIQYFTLLWIFVSFDFCA